MSKVHCFDVLGKLLSSMLLVISIVVTVQADDHVKWCRLRGWFQPRNPGLTAAEVLTSPFFKPCYDQNWAEGVRNFPSQLDEIQE